VVEVYFFGDQFDQTQDDLIIHELPVFWLPWAVEESPLLEDLKLQNRRDQLAKTKK
jgi:hypothetical protein